MAPAAANKPKRKRQRKRREVSSDSGSSSSSDSSSEEEAPVPAPKLPTPSASSDSESSESSSSSSSSSSSDSESSDDDGRGRRRGRAKKQAAAAAAVAARQGAEAAGKEPARRPYPSRSPSPQIANPANVALGQTAFPLLRSLPTEGPILGGSVPGDEGYEAEGEEMDSAPKVSAPQEDKFGEWWRARLVSEFEGDLGGLAAEPGLTPPRLALLLTSLTTLSSLHTTSSAAVAGSARSIWLHDPATAIDPLAAVGDDVEEWGKATVGGEGDVEVGAEGVKMDSAPAPAEAMEVDE